eukprot:CAMPEP_0174355358 /NCGR_PEP_ID=MMETSP0811_2-20130205/24508_1 /TAXON_ID=73025 ORGANISM="Eutreptiella gymnastica-like, Strain CCMP1594" /NCGR_SAMPLE_ID=MMETSP0811_2 /ASSEMBLY_ACC=CAM_ASM_000667 /LENGTH=95 /DNA_ID=CAMNT_0015486685 /DNA_START=228 /DNA_END=515 /DNA_ORIENTATION=+
MTNTLRLISFDSYKAPYGCGYGYGCGDTLHCQKAPYLWAWGHFALPKSSVDMGMGNATIKNPSCCTYRLPFTILPLLPACPCDSAGGHLTSEEDT